VQPPNGLVERDDRPAVSKEMIEAAVTAKFERAVPALDRQSGNHDYLGRLANRISGQ
jgi:hypothetical protein